MIEEPSDPSSFSLTPQRDHVVDFPIPVGSCEALLSDVVVFVADAIDNERCASLHIHLTPIPQRHPPTDDSVDEPESDNPER